MKLRELARKKCVPCKGGMKPIGSPEAKNYLAELPLWQLDKDEKKISQEFTFDNFANAMIFVNCVAHIAEEEGHHPDIHIYYDKVKLSLTTHAIDGLSLNDFILAARIITDCTDKPEILQ